jgi:hypothetical protein
MKSTQLMMRKETASSSTEAPRFEVLIGLEDFIVL